MNRTLIIIIGATLLVLSSGCSAADSTAHAASTTSTCAYVANDGSSLAKVTVTTASACGQVDPDSLGAMATYPDDTFEPAASDARNGNLLELLGIHIREVSRVFSLAVAGCNAEHAYAMRGKLYSHRLHKAMKTVLGSHIMCHICARLQPAH